MKSCPICNTTRIRPYAFTVESERRNAVHYAQSYCKNCDLVFSNPMASEATLKQYYSSVCYEEEDKRFNPDDPNIEKTIRQRAAGEVKGLQHILPVKY